MGAPEIRAVDEPQDDRVPRLRLIQEIDDKLLNVVLRRRATPVTFFFRFLSRAYDPDIVTLWLAILLFCDPFWSNISQRAGMSMLIATAMVQTLKRTVRRTRPAVGLRAGDAPDKYSFPSGHTAVAFALAISAFGSVPPMVPALLVLAGCLGYARMYLAVHYPLDVGAGALVGLISGSIVYLL
jgi:undecaprenyl-diphosphatase